MATKNFFLLSLLFVTCARTQLYAKKMMCPQLYRHVFRGYVPRGNTSSGSFLEVKDIKSPRECVYECCLKEECNVAFMTEDKCYHITCVSNELCVPTLSTNLDNIDHISMVLVRPAPGQETWTQVLKEQDVESYGREMFNAVDRESTIDDSPYKDLLEMEESELDSTYSSRACNVGIESTCSRNEDCVRNFPKSRAGTCKCKFGYFRTDGHCKDVPLSLKNAAINGILNDKLLDLGSYNATPTSKIQLTVTAESKQVKLPDSEVSLKALVSPSPGEGEKYQYEWTSLHKPDGSGAVKEQNGEQLQLTKLSEGLYTFKVNVSSEHAYGETFVNVTVLPPSRINRPPQIIITPANQTIKLPNSVAVLDASSSTDDNGIASWHWELQQGPLGYQPLLADVATLQLNDLSRPGNYTFKITVTDTDKASNSSTANITVLKTTDYQPNADAGQDRIIYLPHNQITLNGNLSTDDHMITTWEWTKSPDDADKAVDMQDTRTPYLRLSDLEKGMYTFVLKVTDIANQSSSATVHVFVKPPTNQPPIASTGPNITISLPQTWVVVDASNSTDDNKIILYKWEKIEGPKDVNFVNGNASKTNVTGLTKGNYVFKVSVTDDNQNVASALQYVLVNQNKNQKPTANAGGNFEVELPRNVIYINGSKSSDDWAIVKWKWTRHDNSLAVGNIAENSDETSVVIITDPMPGKYIFNLTVFDEQGLSDTDTVTVSVRNDPKLFYLVDMRVNADVKLLNQIQYTTLKGKLALLIQDNTKLQVRRLKSQLETDKAIISFYVENMEGKPLSANDVVEHLREKLVVDASLLGFSVTGLQTAICQNNCSGHGVCDEKSRDCICEAFWMQDMFKIYFGSDDDSDCSWSILYVVLGAICGVIAVTGSIWGVIYICLSRCSWKNSRKPSTYKLIEDNDDLPPYHPRKADLSDSDTDSDVVFESRNKAAVARFNNESRNGHKPNRNGFVKMGRRVKT